MKKLLFACALFLLPLCLHAQQIRALKAEDVIRYTSSKDTLYIINFWASWCSPCVAELPEFNEIKERYANAPVKVLLVSLDFKKDYPMRLQTFLERKHITPEVAWLNETDPNEFIPKIDNSWQGSIPATIIVDPGKQFKKFIEGTVSVRQVCKIADRVLATP